MRANHVVASAAAFSAGLALTSAPALAGARTCPPLPTKERVAGYATLNKQLTAYWKLQCQAAAQAGPRRYAQKLHIPSDPVTVAKWLSVHADVSSALAFVAGTNPVGLRLMRPRIHGFLYDAILTGFRLRGAP
jgi:hypothetical protein